MNNQRYKGTRDLTPDDTTRFHIVEQAFRSSCLQWGYQEVKTPVIEYLHLFTSAGTLTPTMLSRVYSFLDWDGWSGERVVLRPDVTIPVARYYTETLHRETKPGCSTLPTSSGTKNQARRPGSDGSAVPSISGHRLSRQTRN